jgi:7-cyano-7-deazaguanine reductase
VTDHSVTDHKLPLGRETAYPNKYQPNLLFPIARSESRGSYLSGELPFSGTDIWNAWELTWLRPGGLPMVATAEIRIPADSPNLIESKSLKLYLNSFAMSRFEDVQDVQKRIADDLAACIGTEIIIQIQLLDETRLNTVSHLPGLCLDSLSTTPTIWEADATLLMIDTDTRIEEDLHSHLLRSLCPVTGQPDIGSIAIHYAGPQIDHRSLLRYIVSFREHNDFHEACIERMFVDILQQCQSEKLSIHARYQRRGGIDINPFRSNFKATADNLRLWRQ